jgi:lipoprotein-anchoring transpeptidase ErfK/SrfK
MVFWVVRVVQILPMHRLASAALVLSVIASTSAQGQSLPAPRGHLGGGFIEFLFGGHGAPPPMRRDYRMPPGWEEAGPQSRQHHFLARTEPAERSGLVRPDLNPKYRRQIVNYDGPEKPGTIIVDTRERLLYLVQEGGTAIRYGIGVGRPGFTWSGVKYVSSKREWPDWRPPPEMLKRRPDLPRYMPGGPDNPLGARALYLGSSLYRIHGSNEPWTIGTQVSSGCIRMRNEDVIDLYDRVPVGAKVVVI